MSQTEIIEPDFRDFNPMEQGPIGYPIVETTKIEQRPDGSFVLDNIYHVANEPEFDGKRKEIEELIAKSPERLIKLPEPTAKEVAEAELQTKWALLRSLRDDKLAATDYLAMPDYPLSEDKRQALMTYRQALRDLPSMEGAPWDGGFEDTPWPLREGF